MIWSSWNISSDDSIGRTYLACLNRPFSEHTWPLTILLLLQPLMILYGILHAQASHIGPHPDSSTSTPTTSWLTCGARVPSQHKCTTFPADAAGTSALFASFSRSFDLVLELFHSAWLHLNADDESVEEKRVCTNTSIMGLFHQLVDVYTEDRYGLTKTHDCLTEAMRFVHGSNAALVYSTRCAAALLSNCDLLSIQMQSILNFISLLFSSSSHSIRHYSSSPHSIRH